MTVNWPPGQKALVVGCGSAGSRTVRLLAQLGVPVSDITGFDQRHVELSHGIPVRDVTELASVAQDAFVFVCSPVHAHMYAIRSALKARAIYVEKPVANLGESYLAGLTLDRSHPFAVVGYNWRFHPAVVRARQMFPRVNKVTASVVTASDMRLWPGNAYAHPILEFSHELDTMRHLFGPGRVTHVNRLPEEPGVVISLRHHSGARSSVEIRWTASQYCRAMQVYDGTAVFNWCTESFHDPGIRFVGGEDWTPDVMYAQALYGFVEPVLRGARPQGCSPREAAEVLVWCERAHEMLEDAWT